MAHFHGAIAGAHLHGNGESQAAGTPVIGAPSASPTGSTTVAVGCTTDTASGTLFVLARIGGSPALAAAIEAGGQSVAVSSTSPGFTYPGLTAATAYNFDFVQKVGAAYSNVVTATATTDNPGSGGGAIPVDLVVQDATHAHTADAVTLTTDSTLAVQDAAHGHTADNVVLQIDGETTMTVDDVTHAHTADSPTLTTSSTLVVQDATHAHTADNVVLTVPGAGAGATAAEIWGYVMANGQTAEANMLAILAGLQAGTFGVDVQYMNGAEIIGDGTEANKWRGVGVPN
jgi:hypothetical protein